MSTFLARARRRRTRFRRIRFITKLTTHRRITTTTNNNNNSSSSNSNSNNNYHHLLNINNNINNINLRHISTNNTILISCRRRPLRNTISSSKPRLTTTTGHL
ncbi:hypothetical protein N3K66_007473 [Trichothecium roseum]|uniref:Uncharacterized protein n=1 Tax=Trichothecium roseum TaxID=47278 RepID=A0ACC0UWM2_9HYPO|nr:hypothetical protein N3K66_007473 [Trichothecium roseum]